MLIHFESRDTDSRLVQAAWRSRSERSGMFHSMAASNLVLVVSRCGGNTSMTVRGPETRASAAECPPDGEWVGIHFRLGAFMPLLPNGTVKDRHDATLPGLSARTFMLDGRAWEYPTFENVDAFAARLVRRGLVADDPWVRDAVRGDWPRASRRTVQRRVLRTTGLTLAAIRQIGRARYATSLLKAGATIADVVAEAGYYDQAHLTRSFARFVGRTPSQVSRGEGQLSFLCNTPGD